MIIVTDLVSLNDQIFLCFVLFRFCFITTLHVQIIFSSVRFDGFTGQCTIVMATILG